MNRAVEQTMQRFGRLDILVANAGVGYRGSLIEADWHDLETLLQQGAVYRRDANGERVYLPDSERDREIARIRERVAVRCEGITGADLDAQRRAQWPSPSEACARMRERVRALESATRVPRWEMEEARGVAQRACNGKQ